MSLSTFTPIGLVFDAIERADHAMVEALAPSMPANYRDAEGHTPLMRAAKRGDARSAELLLPWSDPLSLLEEPGSTRAAAVLAAQCSSEGSAMAMAAERGRADCVRLLAPLAGAGPVDIFGRTALLLAARDGHLECVKILGVGDAPLIADTRDIHWTPLMAAVRYGHVDCVEFLAPCPTCPQWIGTSERRSCWPRTNGALNACGSSLRSRIATMFPPNATPRRSWTLFRGTPAA